MTNDLSYDWDKLAVLWTPHRSSGVTVILNLDKTTELILYIMEKASSGALSSSRGLR